MPRTHFDALAWIKPTVDRVEAFRDQAVDAKIVNPCTHDAKQIRAAVAVEVGHLPVVRLLRRSAKMPSGWSRC